jgi:superfamily II DNA or RNA helicase
MPPSGDLFDRTIAVQLPRRYSAYGRVDGNLTFQVAEAPSSIEVRANLRTWRGNEYPILDLPGGRRIAVTNKSITTPKGFFGAIKVGTTPSIDSLANLLKQRSARWKSPRPLNIADLNPTEIAGIRASVRASWSDALSMREETGEDATYVPGLRPPQIGAIHAIKAHWVVSSEPATLVMPTGTGKTETMLAVLVSEPIETLLVVVPTDALRDQVSQKFAGLGELKGIGSLSEGALYPIVAVLKRSPKTHDEVDNLFGRAQVVVSTMTAVSKMPAELQVRMAQKVSHLFIDEAHHIGAKTWKTLKRRFLDQKRKILQFTATPYRTDERRVDGKFIFVYPLRLAKEQGLFAPIHYVPVFHSRLARADLAIVENVGAALDRDITDGFDHLAMARTDSIPRGEAVLALYRAHLPRYPSALVHSKMTRAEKDAILDRLRNGDLRIIVCVNMLGEGFDLPRLKIAGLHDIHKSEAVTFQFVGRFTRRKKGLGDATVIARISLEDPKELLNALYREDADWNHLLVRGSAVSVERERRREDLYASLDTYFDNIPYDAIAPRLSVFVFRTRCRSWNPKALSGLEGRSSMVVEDPIVSEENTLVLMIMRQEERLRWARVNQPTDVVYNLVMVHWDEESELLYVHSSSVDGIAHQAAKLVAGDDVVPLKGEEVFRVLHGYRQVMLNNLGVRETQAKPVRFQLSTGIDITEELENSADNRMRVKTNLYGVGYVDEPVLDGEGGDEVQPVKRGIGCSTKGKVWSQESVTHPGQWIEWCRTVGPKLADENITTEAALRNVLRPKRQSELPTDGVPLAVEWPEQFYASNEDRITLSFGGDPISLADCDIEMAAYDTASGVRFRVRHEQVASEFKLTIVDRTAEISRVSGPEIVVHRGRRDRTITDILNEEPPAIRFSDGSFLMGADLATPPADDAGFFDPSSLVSADWKGVNIKAESQGSERRADSIQRRVIERVMARSPAFDLVFDGDASGEVADVVAIRRQGRALDVEFYHCKFSSETTPGARVADLYEVCGQAMKSVRWAGPDKRFLARLRRQEEHRIDQGGPTRFQLGDTAILDEWIAERREMSARYSVTIVQPGYAKRLARPEHMPILASVRTYLMQTYKIGFSFWTSP